MSYSSGAGAPSLSSSSFSSSLTPLPSSSAALSAPLEAVARSANKLNTIKSCMCGMKSCRSMRRKLGDIGFASLPKSKRSGTEEHNTCVIHVRSRWLAWLGVTATAAIEPRVSLHHFPPHVIINKNGKKELLRWPGADYNTGDPADACKVHGMRYGMYPAVPLVPGEEFLNNHVTTTFALTTQPKFGGKKRRAGMEADFKGAEMLLAFHNETVKKKARRQKALIKVDGAVEAGDSDEDGEEREILGNLPLSSEEECAWREHGFCVMHDFVDPALARLVRSECYARATVKPSTSDSDPKMPFESSNKFDFPSMIPNFNKLCLSDSIVHAVGQLLGTSDIALTQAYAWLKVGRHGGATSAGEKNNSNIKYFESIDQRMHMDFPNHDLAHPPTWAKPETVAVIVYLDDHKVCGGETGIVGRQSSGDPAYVYPYVNMPGVGALPWINNRATAEDWLQINAPDVFAWRAKHLYPREEYVNFQIGTALFYRHDVWHRGRPVLANQSRLALNLVFKKAFGSRRVNHWNPGFARFNYNIKAILEGEAPRTPVVGTTETMLVSLSPLARTALGWPRAGDPYWTEETLHAAEMRWGPLGMDITPYRDALPLSRKAYHLQCTYRSILNKMFLTKGLDERNKCNDKSDGNSVDVDKPQV